jgi:DNA-binding CsgD family transcriptional regulator
LLSAALKPLYINTRAAEILLYPEKPRKTKDFADHLASKIRAMVTNGEPSGKISVCKEFLSGCRHYICRFFDVHLPGNNSNGSNGSSLALLLERSPRTSVDILKICDQYHLTPREGQAVELLLHGLASKEISARMKISPNTVKVFLRLAMLKMGVSSRSGILSKFINAKT